MKKGSSTKCFLPPLVFGIISIINSHPTNSFLVICSSNSVFFPQLHSPPLGGVVIPLQEGALFPSWMFLPSLGLFLAQDALNEGKLPSTFKLLGGRGAEKIEHQQKITENMSHNHGGQRSGKNISQGIALRYLINKTIIFRYLKSTALMW